jgi:L-fuconolactonase
MTQLTPGTQAWLDQHDEAILEPERPIIDPHHHLWRWPEHEYLLPQLHADTGTGHNIVKTVFVECGARYRREGPDHLKPVGETEFVVDQAGLSRETDGSVIAGIVSHADLTRGEAVEEVLQAHADAGQGLFRGIRHAGARATEPEGMSVFAGRAPEGLYDQPDFRTGIEVLGRRGLTYETWHYHYQNLDFIKLAQAVPGTRMILDHFGTPLGVGSYAGHQEEIFAQWKMDIAELARCENVVMKIGGLAMPDNGFDWHLRDTPATSDEFVAAQRAYYLHTIECFGPDRCMMESNFPVDKMSIAYHVLFNGLKKIVADFSEDEKHKMFYATAERVYKL